jgi:hypothetical protein
MANPSIPDELTLYIREQLARIDLLHADADRKRQEMALAPSLARVEMWKFATTLLAAGAALFAAGAAFIKLVG